MEVLRYILTSIFALCGIALSVFVLMQKGKNAGLGTIGGMESYWEKNRSRSKEGKLENITKWLVIAFFVIAFVLNINF